MSSLIDNCISRIKDRLEYTCTPYEPDDILIIERDGITFVLANPVLGEEAVYDDYGQPTRYIPMRNITLIYQDGGLRGVSKDFTLKIPVPYVRVLRQDLCMMVVGDEISDVGCGELQNVVMIDEKSTLKFIITWLEAHFA